MTGGKGAARRANARRAKGKHEEKKATKKAIKEHHRFIASIPHVTEENLLAFQFTHFGDDTRPNNWFVSKDAALDFWAEHEDEDLGYYDDGVKRTLTDEQIALFRHRESWQMKREQILQSDDDSAIAEAQTGTHETARSLVSEVSSLEDDLRTYASVSQKTQEPTLSKTSKPSHSPKPSMQSNRSDTADSADSRKRRRTQKEIPYDQRHKRKWESYVRDVDPIEGSITHRRMARELDNQKAEAVEMDY